MKFSALVDLLLRNRIRMAVVVLVGLMGWQADAVVIDGQLGMDGYGPALSIQNTDTQFGDAFIGDAVQTGGGSEINGFYAKIENGRLNMMITGNLEENFNKLSLFFDTRPGGHNTIVGSMLPIGVDRFCCLFDDPPGGALQRMNGLTFDTDFFADYFLTISHGYETGLDNPAAPGNPITFWAATAHYSDMTAGADPAKQNVAAGMQLAPRGKPNVLRLNGSPDFSDPPFIPDFLTFGPTDPNHIGPQLPGLGQGELIDRNYAIGPGMCNSDDSGAGCLATELGFALNQAPGDPNNSLSHRNFNNLIDLKLAIDNSNIAGVFGGTGQTIGNPQDVTTGIEISIPLSQIGNPSGDFKVVAFVNGGGHHYVSNQVIGEGILQGNLGGDGTGGFTGDLAGVNFASINGLQYVVVPYTPSTPTGDFNGDGIWDCSDVNALTAAVAINSTDLSFDMNGDGIVDLQDIQAWLAVGGANNPQQTNGNPFLPGDANLDGVVDGQDFILWNINKFTSNTDWCDGNFNGDGVIDGQDFITWNLNKFTSSADSTAVPEPSAVGWLLAGGLLTLRRRWRL